MGGGPPGFDGGGPPGFDGGGPPGFEGGGNFLGTSPSSLGLSPSSALPLSSVFFGGGFDGGGVPGFDGGGPPGFDGGGPPGFDGGGAFFGTSSPSSLLSGCGLLGGKRGGGIFIGGGVGDDDIVSKPIPAPGSTGGAGESPSPPSPVDFFTTPCNRFFGTRPPGGGGPLDGGGA